jgi:predicted ATP-binding protein involved in virulence
MQINKININNFKLFKEKEFLFNSKFNLLVGVNGSGKTSLLRAISIALAGWAHAYVKNDNNLRPIHDEEIREIDGSFDKSKKTSITAIGEADIINRYNGKRSATTNWTRYREEGSTETKLTGKIKYGEHSNNLYPLNLTTLGSDILSYMEEKKTFNLPIIAFYECDRLWLAKNELNLEAAAKAKYSRFDPYVDCFHTGSDHKAVGEWLLKHELASLQQGKPTPVLLAVKKAAITALEKCVGFRFDIEKSRVIVRFEDDINIPFEHLSDGQRTILGLFCDIARRTAILNPHLGGEAIEKTKGIVLIDELDLHLHPKWQRRIIENLRNVFPSIQFICTSHSPFLIQSLRNSEELIMLDGEPLSDYSNIGIEEISRNMGVLRPEVSIRYEEMKEVAKSFLQTLDEKNLSSDDFKEEYKKGLAKLIAPFADNPAYQAFLELEYASKYGERL